RRRWVPCAPWSGPEVRSSVRRRISVAGAMLLRATKASQGIRKPADRQGRLGTTAAGAPRRPGDVRDLLIARGVRRYRPGRCPDGLPAAAHVRELLVIWALVFSIPAPQRTRLRRANLADTPTSFSPPGAATPCARRLR